MSEASLPFNEKYYPNTEKISSGEKRKQEWEKSLKNPQEYWSEKAKANRVKVCSIVSDKALCPKKHRLSSRDS